MEHFGDWINHLDKLSNEYKSNIPFEHVVLNNFFNEAYVNSLISKFPQPPVASPLESRVSDNKWYKYDNPIEKKYALNDFSNLPQYGEIFGILQSDEFVNLISHITGIDNLESDPHLHGAGIHFYPPNGKLDVHLDYSIHPISGRERRVNLIIYLNNDWREEYNGDLQLWNVDFTEPVKRYYPKYNTAILFKTNDISYHGLPTPIKCPDDLGRKSLAIYYVSEPRPNATKRYKAEYRKLPSQPIDDRLEQLYNIRKTRIIEKTDLDRIYPNWVEEGNGYW